MILMTGCTAPTPTHPYRLVHGAAEIEGTSPAWCYATLAEADCFVARQTDATNRLIGAYVPVAIDAPDAE
jgi:hypothetical protein